MSVEPRERPFPATHFSAAGLPQPQSAQPTILLVDRTESRRRSIAGIFRVLDHHFIEASNTAEALEHLAQDRVDLVIADLLVPDKGAVGLCQSIRNCISTSLLPIIVTGRRGQIDKEVAAIDAGADAVLPHTVHPKAFRASVQSCLRRKATVEAL